MGDESPADRPEEDGFYRQPELSAEFGPVDCEFHCLFPFVVGCLVTCLRGQDASSNPPPSEFVDRESSATVRIPTDEGRHIRLTLVFEPTTRVNRVKFDYVMQPCDVKLSYMGRSWCTVRLEIGHNEVGDADEAEFMPVPEDLAETFAALCFPVPRGLPLMRLPYQVAQKLHGATGANSKRAHDIIDLQLIFKNSPDIDLREVRAACERLFAYRKGQAWPPLVVKGADWDTVYQNKKQNLDVLASADAAVDWANGLVSKIATA